MHIIYIELTVLMLLAIISDIMTYKIKNQIILIFTAAGLFTNAAAGGLGSLADSAAGMAVPLVLLFLLYYLRMLGAGDIKLFCAVGAIAGTGFVLNCIAYSFLSGGIIALAVILLRKNARERAMHFFTYLKSCLLSHSFMPYTALTDKSDGSKFRFSYAIALGAIITAILI